MSQQPYILGVDIGSVSIELAAVSPDGTLLQTAYRIHQGRVTQQLRAALDAFDLSRVAWVATTTSTPRILKSHRQVDNRVAVIAAVRRLQPRCRSILTVGGEKFGLIEFDAHGNYANYRGNTACAAGTGSFLDQQADRLQLADSAQLATLAFDNRGMLPKIASRCAVFAKTDLVHAQQEGYALAEICDGLCYGLAKNIVDTLFSGLLPPTPVVFTGGVARNQAVCRHLEKLLDTSLIVDTTSYGALGAALDLAATLDALDPLTLGGVDDLLTPLQTQRRYFFEPLNLTLSDYPDFESHERYLSVPAGVSTHNPVEVDLYVRPAVGAVCSVYLGLDIGSTSTKAVLLGADRQALAGFYTRTAGRPVHAVQTLLAAIDELGARLGVDFSFLGAGTTGSGRKFSGRIIGADLVVDEISAHARAAVALNPAVDTIIEIGGQDSKFTTLSGGQVTFAVMNTVCAAGTGSFVEEQARKLDCPLSAYAERAAGQRSPIISDRCTVFMERDINHYLTEAYAVEEVLASVLHSICENYLTRVAVESLIGKTVTFQGATAKNRALVAAFEQRLGQALHVSKYCHLAGALGVALMLDDRGARASTFKGLALHRASIPIRSETCGLCTNHCKITVAETGGPPTAFGFLCGRDYDTRRYVDNNRSGFDLLRARRDIFARSGSPPSAGKPTVGLPAALPLFEDLPLWVRFFDLLGIPTVTSEAFAEGVKTGRKVAGAEFCAPLTALHGHVGHLLDRADVVFLPFYLARESRAKNTWRQYCYYTQYAPALAAGAFGAPKSDRFLMPLLHYYYTPVVRKAQFYRLLKKRLGLRLSYPKFAAFYEEARRWFAQRRDAWQALYRTSLGAPGEFHVVLFGRPYTVLSARMNKGIPNIFGSLGVKAFFHDMLDNGRVRPDLEPLLEEFHWHYAAAILRSAARVARMDGAYPVLVTSFKCSPDAFVTDRFRQIMNAAGKPYLVLQLDEHDSSVGYETRIEAALRAFRNHYRTIRGPLQAVAFPPAIRLQNRDLKDKTLVLPNWDAFSLKLVCAALRREGVDARLLEETDTSIRRSLRTNSGQCIPLNIIAQEFCDFVAQHDLDPGRTVLWMIKSVIACNLRLYPLHIRALLDARGRGMEKAGIYCGRLSFSDVSLRMSMDTYFAYMFGGFVKKMGCRLRPYERQPGSTDAVIARSMALLVDAFEHNRSKETAVDAVVDLFEALDVDRSRIGKRPKVAIFGDLYARDNDVFNQNLVNFIEANGGEVVTTAFSSYVKMVVEMYLRKWLIEGNVRESLYSKALMGAIKQVEKKYYRAFARVLGASEPRYNVAPKRILASYGVRIEHTGESMDNLLKVFYLHRQHPDLALFVQVSPAFCCPSLVTEAMSRQIEARTGVPVASITYDGTGGSKNDAIIPYLKYPRN